MVTSFFLRIFAALKISKRNMNEKLLTLERTLYRPTPKVEGLVLKLCELFDKPLNNGITITYLSFKPNFLKLGDLMVKSIERENSHSAILVHWYPNKTISTKNDPFCSAFILTPKELSKLYDAMKETFKSMNR